MSLVPVNIVVYNWELYFLCGNTIWEVICSMFVAITGKV